MGKEGTYPLNMPSLERLAINSSGKKNFTTADLKSSYRNMAYFAVIFCSFIFMQVKA